MYNRLPYRVSQENPIARNDVHYETMANDPSIPQFSKSNYNRPTTVLTGAGSNAAQNAEVLIASTDSHVDFINTKWRPLMAFVYMASCVTDFILFPVLWSILQAVSEGQVTEPWQPVTLQGAGLFHIAMGAVLGITAYGRTQEKLENKA